VKWLGLGVALALDLQQAYSGEGAMTRQQWTGPAAGGDDDDGWQDDGGLRSVRQATRWVLLVCFCFFEILGDALDFHRFEA
jgi:hypothetical protein